MGNLLGTGSWVLIKQVPSTGTFKESRIKSCMSLDHCLQATKWPHVTSTCRKQHSEILGCHYFPALKSLDIPVISDFKRLQMTGNILQRSTETTSAASTSSHPASAAALWPWPWRLRERPGHGQWNATVHFDCSNDSPGFNVLWYLKHSQTNMMKMFLFLNGPELRAGSYCYLVISYILFVWVTSSQHTAWKIGRWSATLPGHDLVGHWRSHCVPHDSSSDESLCMGTRGQWETSWEGMIGRHLFWKARFLSHPKLVDCMSVFHPCPSLTAGLGTEQRFPAFCRDLWSQNAKSTVLHLRWGTLIPKGWNNSSHQLIIVLPPGAPVHYSHYSTMRRWPDKLRPATSLR